ncbi:DUF2721 domain-containing protein [Fischerella sp. PCC 9605]|uniref:DUF2721 domain-containing protein n=1 Tax=Fischerella sp. PCC 9605 TaxID=1173024 RepID=UPI000685B9E7|nr:DUF2721 domain-containing protein [Fischerella sp. PCC 9605]
MSDLSMALGILSAMITPAVLIAACSSLILATSQRLGRVIERTRKISDQFEKLMHTQADEAHLEEERNTVFNQISRATRRARLLQRVMACLYLTLSVFVATSIALGIIAILGQQQVYRYTWIPILLGMIGAGLLFYASVLLITESRIALRAVNDEMDFVIRLSQYHAPKELLKRRRGETRRRLFRRSRLFE